MRIVTFLSVATAFASAADYNAADAPPPAAYVPEKPPISAPVLALIAKLVEAVNGYEYEPPAAAPYADGSAVEASYASDDLLKLLKLVLAPKPKKYAAKTTLKILNRLPGVYGSLPPYGVPPYALNPSLLPAAYKSPALGFLHPYGPPHLNALYPPGIPPYHLPLHPAPKLPLGPAYGYPGQAGAYAYPGLAGAYGYPSLPSLPLIILTKEVLDGLKVDDYDAEPAVEPVTYVAKPKKHAVKIAVHPKKAYAAVKAKVVPKVVKAYAAPAKAVKAKAYAKPAAVEVIVPPTVVPAYAAAVTEAPVDLYANVEARAATGGEPETVSVRKVESPQSAIEGGESARTSEQGISSQKTISRIS